MARTQPHPIAARGVTLLEAMVSLTLLLVGITGMLQLQIFAASSDEGARANTAAVQVARELLAGLQQLGPEDPRLDEHFVSDTPPAEFGHLLVGNTLTGATYKTYSDASPLPGVRTDADFLAAGVTDPVDGTLPRFQRRWMVWMPTSAITVDGSKLIAVSVTWREKTFTGLREVILYGTVINPASITAFANFSR
jgi:type IV pilus assembly protein PilV